MLSKKVYFFIFKSNYSSYFKIYMLTYYFHFKLLFDFFFSKFSLSWQNHTCRFSLSFFPFYLQPSSSVWACRHIVTAVKKRVLPRQSCSHHVNRGRGALNILCITSAWCFILAGCGTTLSPEGVAIVCSCYTRDQLCTLLVSINFPTLCQGEWDLTKNKYKILKIVMKRLFR